MTKRICAILLLLAVLLSFASCGKQPGGTEESAGSQPSDVAEESSAETGLPEPDEPLTLDEYLSEERALPERLYTARPNEAAYRYQAFSDGLYRIPKGETDGTLWLEGEWSVVTYDENVVYLMTPEYLLYRVPAETAEPEQAADLSAYLRGWEEKSIGEQGKLRFFSMFGETLFVFRGADKVLYGLYLPTGEVYAYGAYPDTEAVYVLTNRSFLYRLPTGELAEDGFSDVLDAYLCADGKYYRVLSGTEELLSQSPLDPAAIAAFLPIEDGKPVLGDNFEEITAEDAMSAPNAYTAPIPLPATAEEYFSADRYLPEQMQTPGAKQFAEEYYYYIDADEGESGPLRVTRKSDDSDEPVTEMGCAAVTFDAENLYVLDTAYNLWQMSIPDGELRQIASLGEPVLHSFWSVFGEELAVFHANNKLLGVYLPTGEVVELGAFPFSVDAADPAHTPNTPFMSVALTLLTNRSFIFQYKADGTLSEEEQFSNEFYFLHNGADGKLYRIEPSSLDTLTSQYPADPAAIAAFLPIEDGKPVLGENFTEVSPEEAGIK